MYDREGAKDLVQATVVRAIVKQHCFQEGTNLQAWLITVMRSVNYSSGRRRRPATVDITTVSETVSNCDDPSVGLLVRDMETALKSLPEQVRRCLIKAAGGWSGEEIAISENMKARTVRTKIHRGREALRHLMEG